MPAQRLDQAIELLIQKNVSCVVLREKETFTAGGVGVKPLMTFLRQDPRFFEGALVADKVIGKAAAMLLLASGVSEVYGAVMSESADHLLTERGIRHRWGELVPFIRNRDGSGMCPLEEAVQELQDPEEAFSVLDLRIQELMAAK